MSDVLTTPDAGTDPADATTDVEETLRRLQRVQRTVTRSHDALIERGRERAALIEHMHVEHGWSYRRIATALGVSHTAIVQSHNARTRDASDL